MVGRPALLTLHLFMLLMFLPMCVCVLRFPPTRPPSHAHSLRLRPSTGEATVYISAPAIPLQLFGPPHFPLPPRPLHNVGNSPSQGQD